MRRFLFIVTASAVALSTSTAFAGGRDCVCKPHWKRHHARVHRAMPPIYVVNQGPAVSGPMIYTMPTYSKGGRVYRVGFPDSYTVSYPWVGRYRASVLPRAHVVPLPAEN